MPIKFRCNYCRQFLGISRAQAGGVVDCPTCGRSIRVPLLDGTVQPMSGPALNLEDSHLSNALDELARLVDAPVEALPANKSARPESDDSEVENQIPQPLPEPIPIEMAIPPTRIIVQPPANAALAQPAENGVFAERGLLAELASLSKDPSASFFPEAEVDLSRPATLPRSRETSAGMMSICVLSIFLAGMLTERFVRLLERPSGPTAPPDSLTDRVADNPLTGRITYKTKAGESLPDRGARILVFPQERPADAKLSMLGFRPADRPADQQRANALLKALGGAATTVDDTGHFRLPLEAGTYRLLAISHFQPREADHITDPELAKFLSGYFEHSDEVLGRVKYQFSPLRVKGTSDTWDHSF